MIYRKVVKSDVFKFQIPCRICTLAAFVISAKKLGLKFLSYIAVIKGRAIAYPSFDVVDCFRNDTMFKPPTEQQLFRQEQGWPYLRCVSMM